MSTASPVKDGAVFSFMDRTTIKFPDTQAGVVLSHTYKFKNSGTSPLIISDYKVA